MKVFDVIPSGVKAVAVFTRGSKFEKNKDGIGSTGNWKIDPNRNLEKVIIYHRPEREPQAEVHVADISQIKPSGEEGRFIIFFENREKVGDTDLNWFEFAESGSNPVRYL